MPDLMGPCLADGCTLKRSLRTYHSVSPLGGCRSTGTLVGGKTTERTEQVLVLRWWLPPWRGQFLQVTEDLLACGDRNFSRRSPLGPGFLCGLVAV
jgi:hypothetical protein